METEPAEPFRRPVADGLSRRRSDLPTEPSPNGKPRRRGYDGWLDRWAATTTDLGLLTRTHPMMDAVIDEQVGRSIRIGDQLAHGLGIVQLPGLRPG